MASALGNSELRRDYPIGADRIRSWGDENTYYWWGTAGTAKCSPTFPPTRRIDENYRYWNFNQWLAFGQKDRKQRDRGAYLGKMPCPYGQHLARYTGSTNVSVDHGPRFSSAND